MEVPLRRVEERKICTDDGRVGDRDDDHHDHDDDLKVRMSMQRLHTITRSTLDLAKGMFERIDRNKDGVISKAEFASVLGKIHDESRRSAEKDAKKLMTAIHQQGLTHYRTCSESINFNDFLNAIALSKIAAQEELNNKNNANALEVKKFVEKAAWYYGIAGFVAKFYRPHKYEEYTKNYRCWPPPLVLPCVSIFILVVYLYYLNQDPSCGSSGDTIGSCQVVYDSLWSYRYDAAYTNEWWRFVTYIFLHAGVTHLVSNLFLQIVIGVPLEMVHGPWRPFLLYILGGIAGSTCVSVFDERTNTVGASAACYALMGAHVANIFNYYSIMPFAWVRIIFFSFIFLVDVTVSLYNKYGNDNASSTSYTSHIGGLLLGVVLGFVVLDELDRRVSDTFKMVKNCIAITLTFSWFTFALIWNLVNPQPT